MSSHEDRMEEARVERLMLAEQRRLRACGPEFEPLNGWQDEQAEEEARLEADMEADEAAYYESLVDEWEARKRALAEGSGF